MKERATEIPARDVFLRMYREEIAEIVRARGTPKCACIMLDGTRRVLKLEPGYHDDKWLYYEDHIKGLIYKSMEVADTFFDFGLDTVIGPLASLGNLNRKDFMPTGLDRLLSPLLDEYSVSIMQKHGAAISFYGDLDHVRAMNGGEIIDNYARILEKINPANPEKHILLGVGFSTDTETDIIARQAIEFYRKTGQTPLHEDLVKQYFGHEAPPIDIFIRTNEVKPSGGLTPLLTQHDTQMYFPVSPGIMSLSEPVLRKILYDYLFGRVLSHGMHEHGPVTDEEALKVKNFYIKNKNEVMGIGQRVADMWIHKDVDR